MNLTDYIQGRRKGKEAHRIEREAMQDAFLAEALEGFESVAGDHAAAIHAMRRQTATRRQPRGRSIAFWSGMAASVALIIGFGWYFLMYEPQPAIILSEAEYAEIPTDSLKRTEIVAMTEPTAKPEAKEFAVQEKAPKREALPSSSQPAVHAEAGWETVNDEVMIEGEAIEEDRTVVSPEPVVPKFGESLQKPQTELTVPAAADALQGRIAGVQMRGTSSQRTARRVQGKVVDESGEPLPGVVINVKNSATGVVTDTSGEFSLNITDPTTLQASFVGYKTREVTADSSQLLIAMHEDTSRLEEVVITGYGTQRRSNMTGAVSAKPELLRKVVPQPVTGQRAYEKYLRKNAIMPAGGACAGVKGKVQVRFAVDDHGRPYNIQIIRQLCDDADREAIRLIAEGCNWTQGNTEATVTVWFK